MPGREVPWQAVGFMAGLCSLGLGHNSGVMLHPRDCRDSTTPGSTQLPLACQLVLYKVPLMLQGQM